MENLPNSRFAGDIAQDGHERAGIDRLHAGRISLLRREIDQHLHLERGLEGAVRIDARDRRLVFEEFLVRGLDAIPLDGQLHVLISAGESRGDVPVGGTDALDAVAHQPVDVIVAFADVEAAAQIGVAGGVGLDIRNSVLLREVNGRILRGSRCDAEDDGQEIAFAREFLQRNRDFIAGVKAEVEAEDRFHRGDRAGEVFSGLTGIEDGGIVADQNRRGFDWQGFGSESSGTWFRASTSGRRPGSNQPPDYPETSTRTPPLSTRSAPADASHPTLERWLSSSSFSLFWVPVHTT